MGAPGLRGSEPPADVPRAERVAKAECGGAEEPGGDARAGSHRERAGGGFGPGLGRRPPALDSPGGCKGQSSFAVCPGLCLSHHLDLAEAFSVPRRDGRLLRSRGLYVRGAAHAHCYTASPSSRDLRPRLRLSRCSCPQSFVPGSQPTSFSRVPAPVHRYVSVSPDSRRATSCPRVSGAPLGTSRRLGLTGVSPAPEPSAEPWQLPTSSLYQLTRKPVRPECP